MATYANRIKVLRGGEHCLLISLPDKPVWCQALLGLVFVVLRGYGHQWGCEGILGQHLNSATIDGLGC